MTIDSIQKMLQREPFHPFRLVMSSGESYEIRHPELVVPLKSHLFVAMPGKRGQPTDDYAFCSYLHIAHLQTLQHV
jgi:hypothetical protein